MNGKAEIARLLLMAGASPQRREQGSWRGRRALVRSRMLGAYRDGAPTVAF
ncbi:hypothetical protein [Streptomyces sp. H27-C3]|uniref:hypothetical protein n=1 Tax=Streptomyces sp. H27-C3 TaxID=3046305 RepID=UPI0032D998CF